jgi:hypothetical protein
MSVLFREFEIEMKLLIGDKGQRPGNADDAYGTLGARAPDLEDG